MDEDLDLGATFEVGTTMRYRSGESVASLARGQLVVYDGDLGREAQVLSYPVCKAQVYADRSRVLEGYNEGP